MAKRGRPPKPKEPTTDPAYTIKEVEGKFIVYLHGSVRAIRHSEEEAQEYIALVSS